LNELTKMNWINIFVYFFSLYFEPKHFNFFCFLCFLLQQHSTLLTFSFFLKKTRIEERLYQNQFEIQSGKEEEKKTN